MTGMTHTYSSYGILCVCMFVVMLGCSHQPISSQQYMVVSGTHPGRRKLGRVLALLLSLHLPSPLCTLFFLHMTDTQLGVKSTAKPPALHMLTPKRTDTHTHHLAIPIMIRILLMYLPCNITMISLDIFILFSLSLLRCLVYYKRCYHLSLTWVRRLITGT